MKPKSHHSLSILIAAMAVLLASSLSSPGQVPGLLNYQGKITIGTTPFTGAGQFKFALVNATGTTTFWSNNGSSSAGSQPTVAVSLPVVSGLYFVQLGDTSLTNMIALPPTVFQNADVHLRVWFNDGVNGFEQITPDQRIAAVGYAMMAGTVQDGAITSSKIAAGAVGSAQIASGAIGTTQLGAGAVQSANIAAGAVGTAQMADYAITGEKLRLGSEVGTEANGQLTSTPGTLNFTHSFTYPFTSPPTVTLITPDWNLGTVTTSAFSASIAYTSLTLDSTGTVGQYTSLAVVNGYPAISYYDSTDLKYMRATDASGTTWGAPVTVESVGDVGLFNSLAVVNGNPAISYYDISNGDLMFVRARDASGTSWFEPEILDSTGTVGLYASLTVVDGNPAVSYYDFTNSNLKYVRAKDAKGTDWGTPVILDSAGEVGQFTSLAVLKSGPAVSYYDGTNSSLKFISASDDTGAAWETPLTLDDSGNVGRYTSMTEVNGKAAISYYDGTNGNLKYIRATSTGGTAWGGPVVVDSTGNVGHNSLSVVNGRPAISYCDDTNADLKYAHATDASGTAWGTPLTLDATGSVGLYTSLAVVNGKPGISYYDDTNANLKFVLLPEQLSWQASDGTVAPITAATVASGGIGSTQLAANAVQSSNIASGAIGTTQLAVNAVQSSNIADGAIGTTQLAANAVQSSNIAAGAVAFSNLAKPYQSGTVNGGDLAFDFSGEATFFVSFPMGFLATPVVTLSLASSNVYFPAAATVQVTATSAANFTGRVKSSKTPTPINVAVSNSDIGSDDSLAVVNGNPAVSFYDATNGDLLFSRATDPSGNDWQGQRIDTTGDVGPYTSLAVLADGHPAISYYDVTNGNLKFTRADDIVGAVWSTKVNVDFSADDVGRFSSLAVVDGHPAISCYDETHGVLKYIRSSDPVGAGWLPPFNIGAPGGARVGSFSSLAVINGNPAISYYDETNGDLKYIRAINADGSGWGFVMTIDTAGDVGSHTCLKVVNGKPAIAYYDATNGNVKYARALDASGTVWAAPFTIDPGFAEVGSHGLSLAVIGGLPAISYYDATNGDLKYIRAKDASGAEWGVPVALVTTDNVGMVSSLAEISGLPAISYYDATNGDLKYIRQENPTPDFKINWIALPP